MSRPLDVGQSSDHSYASQAELITRLPHGEYLMTARWRIYFRHRSGKLGYIDAPGVWMRSPFGATWGMQKAHEWFRAQPGGTRGWWMEAWQPLFPSSSAPTGYRMPWRWRARRRLRLMVRRLAS